jgi:hypothetical protein
MNLVNSVGIGREVLFKSIKKLFRSFSKACYWGNALAIVSTLYLWQQLLGLTNALLVGQQQEAFWQITDQK